MKLGELKKDELVCEACEKPVNETDEFCPHCGALFEENVRCTIHQENEAVGVCIICCEPFCKDCMGRSEDIHLCNKHCNYEIYEGMARVFGSSDILQAQFAHDCLKQADLHPYIYSRKASPLHLGGADYSLFRPSGDYNGHIINEIKVMVLCQEVIQAEQVLRDLDILD